MKTKIYFSRLPVKTVTRKLAAFAALTLICAIGLSQSAVGGGPGTGGGTIFYRLTCCLTMRTMNSDGTNQTQLGLGTYANVSTQLYNGHRWFLDVRQTTPIEYYPDGGSRGEVVAIRDDFDYNNNNNSATQVRLTNDITFQTWHDG